MVRPKAAAERCELCGVGLAPEHPHLVEPSNRQLFCSCEACALLFSGREAARYRRVPRDIWSLPDFRMSDAQWESLHIPINLVFFFYSSPAGRIVALYPGPAGAVESLLPLEAWQELTEDNPELRELEPDVEALLVNRVGPIAGVLSRSDRRVLQAGRESFALTGAVCRAVRRSGRPSPASSLSYGTKPTPNGEKAMLDLQFSGGIGGSGAIHGSAVARSQTADQPGCRQRADPCDRAALPDPHRAG